METLKVKEWDGTGLVGLDRDSVGIQSTNIGIHSDIILDQLT